MYTITMRSLPFVSVSILALILVFEGFGFGRETTYLTVLLASSAISLSLYLFHKRSVEVPQRILYIWVFFLAAMIVSTVVSVNIERSVHELMYWLSIMIISFMVFDISKLLRVYTVRLIILLSALFTTYSLFLRVIPENFSYLIPQHTYQFVADPFRLNNALGTFLVISLSLLLPYIHSRSYIRQKILFFLLFSVFLTTGTRAAYVGFAVLAGGYYGKSLMKAKVTPGKLLLLLMIILLPIFMFILTVRFEHMPTWYQQLALQVTELIQSSPNESFLSARQYYAEQALRGFIEKPLWGWGPGNLHYASVRHAQTPILSTYVSENVILDVLVEFGVIGTFVFLFLMGRYVISAVKSLKVSRNKHEIGIALTVCSLLIMMMGDSLNWWYGLFLLFFVLLSSLYTEKHIIKVPSFVLIILSLIPFLYFQVLVLSKIAFQKNAYAIAHAINPLNKEVYLPLMIEYKESGNMDNYFTLISRAEKFYKGDHEMQYLLGFAHADTNPEKAAGMIQKSFDSYPVQYFDRARDAYYLLKRLQGPDRAKEFFLTYVANYVETRNFAYKTKRYDVYRDANIMHLCKEEGFSCKFIYSPEMIVERVEY